MVQGYISNGNPRFNPKPKTLDLVGVIHKSHLEKALLRGLGKLAYLKGTSKK